MKRCWPWKHQWYLHSSDPHTFYWAYKTVLLYKCFKCGQFKTKKIIGCFSLCSEAEKAKKLNDLKEPKKP